MGFAKELEYIFVYKNKTKFRSLPREENEIRIPYLGVNLKSVTGELDHSL
jgi:hypothetical protein